MDAHEFAAMVRAGFRPKLDVNDQYGAAMYRQTRSYPESWRRRTFGDEVIDAEKATEQAGREAAVELERKDEVIRNQSDRIDTLEEALFQMAKRHREQRSSTDQRKRRAGHPNEDGDR